MTRHDVCNGDADGLCALQQLRLAEPVAARLVTGRKREIALLERVDAAAGDVVTVLDIALAANRAALGRLLERGARIAWYDHHHAGEVPSHPRLALHIDVRPDVCTSLIVDATLRGAHRRWALVGAYGDGLVAEADRLAAEHGLGEEARSALRELGTDLNYNAYGDSDDDLIAHPARVQALLRGQPDPLTLADDGTLARIRATRHADEALARAQRVDPIGERALACLLPGEPWARRIRGTLAHGLAQRYPERGCAVLTPSASGDYVVSVRAPLVARRGADALCRRFPGGDGRAGAAGIDRLPRERLDEFIAALRSAFA
ncbi:MAG: acetyltransferase [Betaproteobacteria bacterium]|nr:acetyltransferase [Betaproteobacteria bacterium]